MTKRALNHKTLIKAQKAIKLAKRACMRLGKNYKLSSYCLLEIGIEHTCDNCANYSSLYEDGARKPFPLGRGLKLDY